MSLIQAINSFITPLGILILIFFDCYQNKTKDFIQRRIFYIVIIVTAAAISVDIGYNLFLGRTGEYNNRMFFWLSFAFFVLQPIAHNATIVFFDYVINADLRRTKLLAYIISLVVFVGVVLLVLNVRSGFIYRTSRNNEFIRGTFYLFLLSISFSPTFFGIINVILCRNKITRHQMILFLIFLIPTSFGAILDLLFSGLTLMWPFFTTSLLFAYFFIIQRDHRIDTLTGVNNRRCCDEMLSNIEKMASRKPYVFMMIDMDDFKRINDELGHLQGDSALIDTAQLLKDSIRRHDFIARYGGDEFFILMRDVESVDNVVRRIHNNFEHFNAKGLREYTLKLSIGYDVYQEDNEMMPQEFLSHVDELMYKSKGERRRVYE